jgi:hypothetical protein
MFVASVLLIVVFAALAVAISPIFFALVLAAFVFTGLLTNNSS